MECPECGGNVSYDNVRGEYVCNNCGLVVEDNAIDYGPEFRIFDKTDLTRVRTGPSNAPTLSTLIGSEGKDAYGRKLNSKRREEMFRIRKWQKIEVIEDIRRRKKDFQKLVIKYCMKISLPRDIPEIAIGIYDKLRKHDLLVGYNNDDIAVATIYIACRMKKEAIPLRIIARHMNRDSDKIARLCNKICRLLNIELPMMSAREYMYSFASALNLQQKTIHMAEMLLNEIERRLLSNGRSPPGVACAVLYISSKINREKVTQRMLQEIGGITEVTIRNNYRIILKQMKDFIQSMIDYKNI